jgi:methyl-accepting chemotaxis protein
LYPVSFIGIYEIDYTIVEGIMFNFNKNKDLKQEEVFTRNLVNQLEKIYEINANYGLSGDAYLQGNNEVEEMINKILELKNSQVRE